MKKPDLAFIVKRALGISTLGLIIFSSFTMTAKAQQDSNFYPGHIGFKQKSNAKNAIKNNLKEGLWVEYVDSSLYVTTDTNAPFYTLTYYINGDPYKEIIGYFRNGKLWSELPLENGKKNGVQRIYYPNGRIKTEVPYTKGAKNGLHKEYYEDGTLKATYPFTDGKLNGIQKSYYPDGKLNLEITYKNGQAGETKVYGKDGKEIK